MHINKIDSDREASLSDSDKYVRITRRKNAKTGILRSTKSQRRALDRNQSLQRCFVIYKKAVMPERKYTLHSADYCTGVRTKHLIKDGMGGPMVISTALCSSV